ncbi:MAG: nucleotidyltransferase domain-containing protein [Chloroflexota bacterium]|nr:nucleotidyltransferase domain-containing protein [Chloroflexota bacterium]
MNPIIAERAAELKALCVTHAVMRLELFGSAATGEYRPGQSDLDFLVEFHDLPDGGYADAYFGLIEALEDLFQSPIDLIVDSAIENPYFRQSVNSTRQLIYAS